LLPRRAGKARKKKKRNRMKKKLLMATRLKTWNKQNTTRKNLSFINFIGYI
jgi:hypothetical protein